MAMPSLVLLPGLDGTGDFFQPLLEALEGDIDTHVVRYPAAGAYDYATCQQLVRAELPEDEPYVLLGESFSGPVAIVPAKPSRNRLEAVADCDVRAALSSVRVPILCLVGTHDRLIPGAAARLIQKHAPAATLTEIDAPHCLLQCAPRPAAAKIRE